MLVLLTLEAVFLTLYSKKHGLCARNSRQMLVGSVASAGLRGQPHLGWQREWLSCPRVQRIRDRFAWWMAGRHGGRAPAGLHIPGASGSVGHHISRQTQPQPRIPTGQGQSSKPSPKRSEPPPPFRFSPQHQAALSCGPHAASRTLFTEESTPEQPSNVDPQGQ